MKMKMMKSKIKGQSKKLRKKIKYQSRKAFSKFKELKSKFRNLKLLTFALFLVIFWFFFELELRIYDLYRIAYWVDIPGHFIAGIVVASIFIWLSYQLGIKKKNFFTLAGVLVFSILFEIGEMAEEWIFLNPPHLRDVFIWDGFWDIIVNLISAGIFLILFKYKIKKKLGVDD